MIILSQFKSACNHSDYEESTPKLKIDNPNPTFITDCLLLNISFSAKYTFRPIFVSRNVRGGGNLIYDSILFLSKLSITKKAIKLHSCCTDLKKMYSNSEQLSFGWISHMVILLNMSVLG